MADDRKVKAVIAAIKKFEKDSGFGEYFCSNPEKWLSES